MLEKLKKANKNIEIISVFDDSFKLYGNVLDYDAKEVVREGKKLEMPEAVIYKPSLEAFEKLSVTKEIANDIFGYLPMQAGVCYGHASMMNATEWHTSTEINIAITDMVLILGNRWDIVDDKIDSSSFKAFFVPEGTVVELYATTLHYCPSQTSDDGFICAVYLPEGTNTALEEEPIDKRITAKNKWLLAHVDNEAKIKQGAVPGITGINYKIVY